MDGFQIKYFIAGIFDGLHITDAMLFWLNKRNENNYIRIVNYHFSPMEDEKNFMEQISWFLTHFENCDMEKFELFLNGEYVFKDKPGIVFSFDDGFLENYEMAEPILKKNCAIGWYMVSAGLIGKKQYTSENGCHDYMTCEQLKNIISSGGVIGCHTWSHHRMDVRDNKNILQHEIIDAKEKIQECVETPIDIFCWCGGEECTYTKSAAKYIRKAGYRYAFTTNSAIVKQGTDRYCLDRSNVETSWPLSLVKFQICGIMDWRFKAKRKRVSKMIKECGSE